jgi:hypothetical protein
MHCRGRVWLAVEAHKCRHRERQVLGMGLQGLEVTASSSEGLSFTIRSVEALRNCLENCLVCSAIHRGRVGAVSTQHARMPG